MRRCFDATQWHEHRKQIEGVYGTRIDLGDKLVKRTYYALMCSRTRMYLCSSDRKWFRGTSEPGALLRRGYHPAMDGEVRSLACVLAQAFPLFPMHPREQSAITAHLLSRLRKQTRQ